MSAVNGLTVLLAYVIVALVAVLVVVLVKYARTTQALIDERADHAATRYDLGVAWSAYDAVRALHEEADLGIVELRMPRAVREHLVEAAKDRHPSTRGLRVVGGQG